MAQEEQRDYATELDMGDQGGMRLAKLQEMRSLGIDPYPPRSHRTMTAREAIEAFEAWEREQTTDDGRRTTDDEASSQQPAATPQHSALSTQHSTGPRAVLTGRLRLRRTGGKVTFAHIEDESGRV